MKPTKNNILYKNSIKDDAIITAANLSDNIVCSVCGQINSHKYSSENCFYSLGVKSHNFVLPEIEHKNNKIPEKNFFDEIIFGKKYLTILNTLDFFKDGFSKKFDLYNPNFLMVKDPISYGVIQYVKWREEIIKQKEEFIKQEEKAISTFWKKYHKLKQHKVIYEKKYSTWIPHYLNHIIINSKKYFIDDLNRLIETTLIKEKEISYLDDNITLNICDMDINKRVVICNIKIIEKDYSYDNRKTLSQSTTYYLIDLSSKIRVEIIHASYRFRIKDAIKRYFN